MGNKKIHRDVYAMPVRRSRAARRGNQSTEGAREMIRTALVVAMLGFGATALVAQSDPIAARKTLMKANGDQSKIATDMLEAKQPFDLAAAKKVLATFAEAGDKAPTLFPDNSKTGGGTAAVPGVLGNKAGFTATVAQHSDGVQGRHGRHQGFRQLQDSNHRGAQELRRLPSDLPQANLLIVCRVPRSRGGRRSDGPPFGFGGPVLCNMSNVIG